MTVRGLTIGLWLGVVLGAAVCTAADAGTLRVQWLASPDGTIEGTPTSATAYRLYTCDGTCTVPAGTWTQRAEFSATACASGECQATTPFTLSPPGGTARTYSAYLTALFGTTETAPSVVRTFAGAEPDLPLLPPGGVVIDVVFAEDVDEIPVRIGRNGEIDILNVGRRPDATTPRGTRFVLVVTEDRRRVR